MAADAIVVSGLRILGRHGALPGETDQAQPFEVDLEVSADLARAGDGDDLDATIDYAELVAVCVRVVADESHRLLERLAERIAEEVRRNPRVTSVTVTVRKLRPPVAAHLAFAAVRLTRP